MLGWLISLAKGQRQRNRQWTLIYSEDGLASSRTNPRKIPRWLSKRIRNLKPIPPDRYYVFKGKRFEYRVSFSANLGHGKVIVRAPRK